MFEKYVEKDLVRKIDIINLLWENTSLNSVQIANFLNVTIPTIKSDIKIINSYYCLTETPLIISDSKGHYISNKNCNRSKYLAKIYKDSVFVRACCFFLTTTFSDVHQFACSEFISVSKAYYVKEKVINYFKEIGVQSNTGDVNECRLRFLLTFFQMKTGEEIINISSNKQKQFDYLFEEIEQQENCLLSDYSKKYASILFQIHFKRRRMTRLNFDQNLVDVFKQTKVYKRLSQPITQFLEKELHENVKEEEIFFFILVFNIMNANYLDETEKLETYRSYVDFISSSPILFYRDLVSLFEKEFNIKLEHERLFEASLISFLRKCIFNLQALIPEEHIEVDNIVEVPKNMLFRVKCIFSHWNTLTRIDLIYSEDHIKYFTSKLYFLISKKTRPKRIYLLTSFYTDYLLAKEILNREYGSLASIYQFNPKKKVKDYSSNDLVLYDSHFEILKQMPCLTLKISYVFDLAELQRIRSLLFSYELKGITCKCKYI
ncbi:hypothetical protein ACTPL8_002825 [Enterococcus faecium]